MADEQVVPAPAAGFDGGYESDETKTSSFSFGLNANNTYLTKMEWMGNGGKDGAPGEAFDIVFMINGTEKKARKFPVTQAFGKNNEVIKDPAREEFKDAQKDFKSFIVHILNTLATGGEAAVKAALQRPFDSFKQYCQVCASLLPAGFDKIKLDIFLHYQYALTGENKVTYLDIPKNMKQGAWLAKSQDVEWTTLKKPIEGLDDNEGKALMYVTYKEEPVEGGAPKKVIDKTHRFVRTGWFMKSNFANQQKRAGATSSNVSAVQAAAAQAGGAGKEAASNETW